MNTYLAIITTVLVLTQIIRLIQNSIQIKRQDALIKKQLDGLDDITQIDIENQRKAYRLIIRHLEARDGEGKA